MWRVDANKPQRRTLPRNGPLDVTKAFFPNAHGFVLHHPNMFEGGQHTHVQLGRSEEALRWLEEYIMQGAEFNSYERDPPPRCHPDTRVSTIRRAKTWIANSRREKKLLWVRGPAGVGKSAIVQTLAEILSEEKRLGASVFFSRPNGRNNPHQVFPSIAYQLAVQNPEYRAYIADLMLEDPRSLCKSMKEQFRILIVEPFAKRQLRNGSEVLVVALDGLDECEGDPTEQVSDQSHSPERTSDYVQCEIVQLISGFVLQYPSVPLIWIIASRPEKHLQAAFYDEDVEPSFWEEDIPVDTIDACQDVEKFLNSEFRRIRKKYPDHVSNTIWPSSEHFLLIAKAASGLFIFAKVVTRFIEDPMVKNPVAQLRYVLSAISKVSRSKNQKNPLAILDAIYTEIIRRVPSDMLAAAKKLIACIAHCGRAQINIRYANLCLICNFLGITRDIAVTILCHLHSVMFIPSVKDIGMARPQFYHASFRDFLEDPSRSHEYSIGSHDGEGVVPLSFLDLVQTSPLCASSLPWPGEEGLEILHYRIEDIQRTITDNLRLSSPNPVTISLFEDNFFVTDVQLPLLFVGLRFDKFVASRPARVDMLAKMTESRLREFEHNHITSRIHLGSLGIDRDAIQSQFMMQRNGRRLLFYRKGRVLMPPDLRLSSGVTAVSVGNQQMHNTLCSWIEAGLQQTAQVWGCKELERCAVIWKKDFEQLWPTHSPDCDLDCLVLLGV